MYIGGGDPKDTNHTPFKAMTFRVRKITAHRYSSNTKTITNTNTPQTFVRSINANHLKESNAVEGKNADFKLKERGYSLYDSVSSDRGYSVINGFDGFNADGMERLQAFLGSGKSSVSSSQFGKDSLRSAGANGKGMASAGSDSSSGPDFTCLIIGTTVGRSVPHPAAGPMAGGLCIVAQWIDSQASENPVQYETTPEQDKEQKVAIVDAKVGRPAPDDNGDGEGRFMTWKLQDQLSGGFKNAKDPIINPNRDGQGGGVLTASELQEMMSDLRNAKDPATNWGDDTYVNFVGTIEMNNGELSLKDPATNWGDNFTSSAANVVATVYTVQDVF